MSQKKSLQENVKDFGMNSLNFATKHRFIFVVIVVGMALSFALIKTKSAIDISRNEERYSEELLKINYKEIDSETLESFKLSDEDGKIEVNSNFDPNRQNPFTE